MGDHVTGIAGMLIGFAIGWMVGLGHMGHLEKHNCEELLPRDVECTWQPPKEQNNGR